MNKQELIEAVALRANITKASAEKVISTAFETIAQNVKRGNEVRLVGFGTFVKAKRKARVGRNPQTGQEIKIPATNFPKFKPGADFKALVR